MRAAPFLFFGLLLSAPSAQAEYRIYELQINGATAKGGATVLSTLDQFQYPTYHPLNRGETVTYLDSWMCYENMSEFRQPCAKPERKPAATAPIPKTGKSN